MRLRAVVRLSPFGGRAMNRKSRCFCVVSIFVCAIAIYIYPLALPTPLLDPDEGIHARIAQEMVASGDYLVPHLNGRPFRDKPALYSATQALSLRVFGESEAALRVPGAIFAILGSITTVILARRLFDIETSLYAAFGSLTLALPGILAQSPAHDIALVPWTNLMVLAYWEQEHAAGNRKKWGWVAAMSLCIAMALLTKGLIGIAVIATGLGLYSIVSRTLSMSLVVRCSIALFCGGIIASPWFLWMEHASPGYLFYYFIDRHVLGYVTEGQEHGLAPIYYYVGPVIGGAMPWIVFAVASVWQLRYDVLKLYKQPTLLLACWFVGGFAFLSAANSKLVTYSLPIFPPIAILAGLGFRRMFHGELASPVRKLFVANFRITAFFGVISPIVALLFLRRFLHAYSPLPAFGLAVIAMAVMAIEWWQFERRGGRSVPAIGMLWFPIVFVGLMTWPVQPLAEQNSQRALAQYLNGSADLPEHIVLFGQRVGSVLFYLTPEKRALCDENRMREVLITEMPRFLPPPPGTLVAVTNKEVRRSKWKAPLRSLNPQKAGLFNIITNDADAIRVATQPASKKQ